MNPQLPNAALNGEAVVPKAATAKKVETSVRAISLAIVQGKYLPGNLLPSESELGRLYDVSRPLVREALSRLANLGLVETRHGIGSYVKPPTDWQLLEPLLLQLIIDSGHIPDIGRELVELRASIEVEAARCAAKSITDSELQQLQGWLHRMDASMQDDTEAFARADVAFHNIIILSTNNRFFAQIMNKLAYPLISARRITSELGGLQSRTEAQVWHRRIFAAIAARDPTAAADAMRSHMAQLDSVITQALAMVTTRSENSAGHPFSGST
jgi:GntR family transcriptional regulator, transcriptional repressor for pyruvate dehydrogenase complex